VSSGIEKPACLFADGNVYNGNMGETSEVNQNAGNPSQTVVPVPEIPVIPVETPPVTAFQSTPPVQSSLDQEHICPGCHLPVGPTDYFCANCGKNLHPPPVSLSAGTIVSLCLGSLILPPMGIIWSFKYLRDSRTPAKLFGLALILVTVVLLIVLTQWTISVINQVNDKVNSQIGNIQGL
jgi:hypothetical protein